MAVSRRSALPTLSSKQGPRLDGQIKTISQQVALHSPPDTGIPFKPTFTRNVLYKHPNTLPPRPHLKENQAAHAAKVPSEFPGEIMAPKEGETTKIVKLGEVRKELPKKRFVIKIPSDDPTRRARRFDTLVPSETLDGLESTTKGDLQFQGIGST